MMETGTQTRRMAFVRRVAAPTVACVVSQALFFALKQKVFIQPELWHLLDFEAMRTDFVDSFALLHSSPPVLSLIFAAALRLRDAFGWELQPQITTVYVALTCGALFLWHEVALRVLRSAVAAAVVMALLVANPSLVVQQAWAFTPPIEMFLCGAIALAACRWHESPTRGRLAAMALALVVLVYTRSLWHPLVALPIGVGLAAAAWRKGLAPRRAALHGAAFVAIVWGAALPWMAKNAYLFGHFGFTSWMSFNMRMGNNGIWHFVETGEYSEADAVAFYKPWLLERLRANPETGRASKTGRVEISYPNLK